MAQATDDLIRSNPTKHVGIIIHWSQASCVCFVTWRLNDALPAEVLEQIEREIVTLLNKEGLDPQGNWKEQLSLQSSKRRGEIQWRLFMTRDKFLDQGFGAAICQILGSRYLCWIASENSTRNGIS